MPQGTLLGPVTFLVHNNDFQTDCAAVKYVDDATIWESCAYTGADSQMQQAGDQTTEWSEENNMLINTEKTKEMVIYFGRKPLALKPITICGKEIERVDTTKILGVIVNNNLKWNDHVDYICGKAGTRIYFLIMLQRAGVPPEDIIQVYKSIV